MKPCFTCNAPMHRADSVVSLTVGERGQPYRVRRHVRCLLVDEEVGSSAQHAPPGTAIERERPLGRARRQGRPWG